MRRSRPVRAHADERLDLGRSPELVLERRRTRRCAHHGLPIDPRSSTPRAGLDSAGMRGIAFLIVVACSPPPKIPTAAPMAAASSVTPVERLVATPTLRLVTSLEALLERDALVVDDVVAAVGPIVTDPGIPMPITLRPSAPEIIKAELGRYPAGDRLEGVVYLLELGFSREARPTLDELGRVFGEGRPGHGFHGERFTMFYPLSRSAQWSVAVIASLPSCFDPHSDAVPANPCEPTNRESRVESVTFRRDPAR